MATIVPHERRLRVPLIAATVARVPRGRSIVTAGQVGFSLSASSHNTVARVLLRVHNIEELLEALHLDGPLFTLQVLKFIRARLSGAHVLRRALIDGAFYSQHAGNHSAALPDGTGPAELGHSLRAANHTVDLVLSAFNAVFQRHNLGGAIEDLDAELLQLLLASISTDMSC